MNDVIVIDGVVGAGKTTLGEKLEKALGMELYKEMSSEDTYRLLDKFYADKNRWSFTMQIHFLNIRFAQIKEIHRKDGGLLDRSIFGDRIFAEMLMEDGDMSEEEFNTYSTLLDNMLEHAKNPTLMIFIDCDVDTAMQRIHRRNRGLESDVERTYWERLNDKYERWIDSYTLSDVIRINAKEFDSLNDEHVAQLVERIKPYLVK